MSMRLTVAASFVVSAILSGQAQAQLPSGWRAHDLKRPAPRVVNPGESPASAPVPSDAIVLFDGSDMSQWRSLDGGETKWKVVDGAMESVAGAGYAYTKEEFGDCQVHVEWASPATVKGKGQGRGNSGVFLMGVFEVQVLDSVNNETYADGGAGSIYGQFPPLVNVSRGPGQWQSYDIIFQTPRFDDQGALTTPARITVLHNGVLIHHAAEPYGQTGWITYDEYTPGKTRGPIGLQDHGNPVRFRNIWVRSLEPRLPPAESYPEEVAINAESAALLAGNYEGNKVELRDGKLYFRFRNRPAPLEMVCQGDNVFGFRKTAGELKFAIDGDGKPTGISFTLDAAGSHTAKKSE